MILNNDHFSDYYHIPYLININHWAKELNAAKLFLIYMKKRIEGKSQS